MEQPVAQKLPTGLAGMLNGPDDHRDSAYYSIDHASKHNSTVSTNCSVTTPGTDGSSCIEKTPSPISTGANTQPLNSPASGGMSVASMVSPTSPDNLASRFSQQSYDSMSSAAYPPNADSRRESVDSRLGVNFGDMRLATSPYASQNQSTTSLQNSLAQQRNPGSAVERNSGAYRFSNGYQPHRQPSDVLSPRMITSRTAPAITGPALGNIARAPEPTKGQAWAFPEEEVQRLPSAARPSTETPSRQGTSFFDDSRRNSLADSIASSQYTTESRLPAGQRRLEDGMPHDFNRLSRASSDFRDVSTHHHSLQHRQLNELQDDEGGSPGSSQPYSRTPELRVSHKLAERKRRTEMKELFDTLNSRQHHDRGSKASKWEILTKAIAEDERKEMLLKAQQDEIQRYKAELQRAQREFEACQQEMSNMRLEANQTQIRVEYNNQPTNGFQNPAPAVSHPQPSPSHVNGYGNGQYERPRTQPEPHQPQMYNQRPTELPPLRAINGSAPEAMSGIQYQQQDHRMNGYRAGGDRF